MQATQVHEYGGADLLEYAEYPGPEVGDEEDLVDVTAGALNHRDVWTRWGVPGGAEPPHVTGSDAAGIVDGGRLVTRGATPETGVARLFSNQLENIGATMGTPGELDDVLSLVWDGTFEPHIRETLPTSETTRAHELLEDREGFGKVVVVLGSEY